MGFLNYFNPPVPPPEPTFSETWSKFLSDLSFPKFVFIGIMLTVLAILIVIQLTFLAAKLLTTLENITASICNLLTVLAPKFWTTVQNMTASVCMLFSFLTPKLLTTLQNITALIVTVDGSVLTCFITCVSTLIGLPMLLIAIALVVYWSLITLENIAIICVFGLIIGGILETRSRLKCEE